MISLPVLAVSAAAVIIKTADVSGVEGIERHARRRRRPDPHRGPRHGRPGPRPRAAASGPRSASPTRRPARPRTTCAPCWATDARLPPDHRPAGRGARLGDRGHRLLDHRRRPAPTRWPRASSSSRADACPRRRARSWSTTPCSTRASPSATSSRSAAATLTDRRRRPRRHRPRRTRSSLGVGRRPARATSTNVARVARRGRPRALVDGAATINRDRRRSSPRALCSPTRPTSRRWPSRWATTPAATRCSPSSR